jgi:hypothetical protein
LAAAPLRARKPSRNLRTHNGTLVSCRELKEFAYDSGEIAKRFLAKLDKK